MVEYWNIYWIRKFRYDIIYGVLDVFYYLFEGWGGELGLFFIVFDNKINYVEDYLIERDENNEYFEYF